MLCVVSLILPFTSMSDRKYHFFVLQVTFCNFLVGFNGQNSLTSFGGDLEGAKMEFGKK